MRLLILAVALLAHFNACAEQQYQRIVSLAPNFTEIVYAVGGEDRLVGVVEYSDYPEAAKSLPRIGDALRVDLERLLVMQPDLVLVWASGTPRHVQEQLREKGFRLWVREPEGLDDIGSLIIELGKLTGREMQAGYVAEEYRIKLDELRARYSNKETIRLFYQITDRPLMTINHMHMINEAIELCSGENIFAGLPVFTPVVSQEAVYVAEPDLIVSGAYDGGQTSLDWVDPAMIDVPLGFVSADLLHRATPRTLQGVEQLCKVINGVRR